MVKVLRGERLAEHVARCAYRDDRKNLDGALDLCQEREQLVRSAGAINLPDARYGLSLCFVPCRSF